MLIIRRQKSFHKDLSKLKMSDKHYARYISCLADLINGRELPAEARNHSLQGEWKDTKEFHISGDLLVVYSITNNELVLIRIGSHSQLFN